VSFEPLSFDDAFEILRPALPDDSLILVGGQAVNYWLTYYRGRDERLSGLAGVTSDDVDFLGTLEAAQALAAKIHGTLRAAKLDDHVPNTATVTFKDARGQERTIDFLASVHGFENDAILRETALPVEVLDAFGKPTGIEVRVLHPVLCLWSRVHNTHTFAKYQTERALKQLHAAIGCAGGFILEQCREGEIRAAHRAIRIVGQLARGPAGRDVYSRFGADPLDAVPRDPRLGQAFLEKNLPLLFKRAGR
jgi:hypothetical protein